MLMKVSLKSTNEFNGRIIMEINKREVSLLVGKFGSVPQKQMETSLKIVELNDARRMIPIYIRSVR